MDLTQEILKQHLDYNPETGVWVWKTSLSNRVQPGRIAGGFDSNGYRRFLCLGKLYKAHRLAFLYMEGAFPPNEVDHINGIRDDNRWSNLRHATHAENVRNAKMRSDNTSGIVGVCWHKRDQNWLVQIGNSNKKHLGNFSDFFEACCARKSAEIKLDYHKNHGRNV